MQKCRLSWEKNTFLFFLFLIGCIFLHFSLKNGQIWSVANRHKSAFSRSDNLPTTKKQQNKISKVWHIWRKWISVQSNNHKPKTLRMFPAAKKFCFTCHISQKMGRNKELSYSVPPPYYDLLVYSRTLPLSLVARLLSNNQSGILSIFQPKLDEPSPLELDINVLVPAPTYFH